MSIQIKKIIVISLAYVLVGLFFFGRYFNNTFWGSDFIAYWLPQYHYVLTSLSDGSLPLWQPYSFFGVPGAFKSELAVFYPGNILIFVFNLLFNRSLDINFLGLTLQLLQYAHLVLGSVGVYLLLKKRFGCREWTAFIGGVVYSFSLFSTSRLTHGVVLDGLSLLPWLIYSLLSLLENPSYRNFMLSLFFNLLLFLLGYPYYLVYFSLAQLALAFSFGFKGFIRLTTLLVSAALLSSFVLIPALHIYKQAYRSQGIVTKSETFHKTFSFPPSHIISIFNPLLYDSYYSPQDPQNIFQDGRFGWGTLLLPFLVLGLLAVSKNRLNLWLIALFILSIVYSLGGYLAIPQFISPLLPVISQIRKHSEGIALAFFAGSLLIAQGLDLSFRGVKNNSSEKYLALFSILILTILVLLPSLCLDCLTESAQPIISTYRSSILLLAGLLLMFLLSRTKSALFLLIILAVSLVEYSFYFRSADESHFPAKYSTYYNRTPLLPELSTSQNLFRYYFENNQYSHNSTPLRQFQYMGYEVIPYAAFYRVDSLDFETKLKFANVKYYVSTQPYLHQKYPTTLSLLQAISPTDFPQSSFYSTVPDLPYYSQSSKNIHYIYEVNSYLPRFFVPYSAVSCNLTDCPVSPMFPQTVSANIPTDFVNPIPSQAAISVDSYLPNKISLTVNAQSETFVSSSEVWDSGWQVVINGKKSQLYNANGFRAFKVPAGIADVKMNYRPPGLKMGLVLSGLGILFVLFLKRKIFYA